MAGRSESELERAAELVDYDRNMLLATFEQLADNMFSEATMTASHNAHLESFLLHVRTLSEFLESRGTHDDVQATHYMQGWSPAITLTQGTRDALNSG